MVTDHKSTTEAERIAALLDGRLDERERADLLAHLATSDDAYEAFVDAAAVTREFKGGESGTYDIIAVPAAKRAPGRWTSRTGWFALAAVLAGVAVLPFLRTSFREPQYDDPGRFVSMLESDDAGLPPGWNGRPWTTTRGASDPLTPRARAVRLGARLVDLELGVRTQDSSVAVLAAEIAALLEDIPAAGAVAAMYRDLQKSGAERPMEVKSALEQGRVAVARLAGEEPVAWGAWLEGARIALARGDVGYIESRRSRSLLRRVAARNDFNPRERAAIARVLSAATAGVRDRDGAIEDLMSLLRAAGS